MSRMGPRAPVEARVAGSLSINDLMWVANTAHGPAAHWHARPRDGEPDHDHLHDPDDARRYLADHRVPVPDSTPPPDALDGLRAIRTSVHALIDGAGDPTATWTPAAADLLDSTAFRLDSSGRLAARGGGWEAFVGELLLPLVDLTRRSDRLGRCGNLACRLAYLDDTRNHARRWCDPGGCGNRVRVRRARRAAAGNRNERPGPAPKPQPPR